MQIPNKLDKGVPPFPQKYLKGIMKVVLLFSVHPLNNY